ncbi:putative outer membrane protein [Vibrio orientalis CIP 102891 = ATCC 33934]|uniref:Outer membrane protein n=1 Tax=Vibrio orientalis CIP 102891 = ATCC 33934 TaxID=675816 RepID=C9QHX2_VIBOR|nr:OmpA family protein [Vibrio orientalis]EEX92293.1 outer membrane protein [Vibrio orientalis CIP 102891 = ATCC 33934]EGU53194.1 putative outer membrane protein [Vibrio orientalis CIP 102891 = ATCC 33934]
MNKSLLTMVIAATVFVAPLKAEDAYEYKETPKPNQVDDLLDEDKDGVINARDLCPQTPAKADIDNDGCGTYIKTEEEMDLHILFQNDSSIIQPMFLAQIREMSEFLEAYPSTSIELQGYASKVGKAEYNQKLSERRAEAVEAALLDNGVSSSRVRIVGFGDTRLDELGDDEVSHAMNRKVIATVVGLKGNVKEEWSIFTKIEK